MSKVEGGGGLIDPPSRLRVTIFSRRLLGLNNILYTCAILNLPQIRSNLVIYFLLFIAFCSEVPNDPRCQFHGLAQQQPDVCQVLPGHRAVRGRVERSCNR